MYWRYFGALFLIAIGVLFFLNNLGLLPGSIWGYFWPLFLILFGLLFLAGALGRGGRGQPMTDQVAVEGATSARIAVKHGAGRLAVSAGSDPTLLLKGRFGTRAETRVRRSGDRAEVSLQAAADWVPGPWFFWSPGVLDWDLALNPAIPLELSFETGASQAILDLSGLRVTELSIKTGASSTEITLPANAGLTRARIESGAASVRVRVPPGVAGRISGKMGLGALDVDQRRFVPRAGGYESYDYATAANRVELQVEGGVGAVDVR